MNEAFTFHVHLPELLTAGSQQGAGWTKWANSGTKCGVLLNVPAGEESSTPVDDLLLTQSFVNEVSLLFIILFIGCKTDHFEVQNGSPWSAKRITPGAKRITLGVQKGSPANGLSVIWFSLLNLFMMFLCIRGTWCFGTWATPTKKPAAGDGLLGGPDVWTKTVQWLCVRRDWVSRGFLFHTSVVQGEAMPCPSNYVIGSHLQKLSGIFEIHKRVEQHIKQRSLVTQQPWSWSLSGLTLFKQNCHERNSVTGTPGGCAVNDMGRGLVSAG